MAVDCIHVVKIKHRKKGKGKQFHFPCIIEGLLRRILSGLERERTEKRG